MPMKRLHLTLISEGKSAMEPIDPKSWAANSEVAGGAVPTKPGHQRWQVTDPEGGSGSFVCTPVQDCMGSETSKRMIVLISWQSSPIGERDFNVQPKSKGFGKKVMAHILARAGAEGIDTLEIWQPTEQAQQVMRRFSDLGLIDPIPGRETGISVARVQTGYAINQELAQNFAAELNPEVVPNDWEPKEVDWD